MATNSNIEWTNHTFNPWRGCTKVSEGCAHCYAETMSKRNPSVLGVWGKNGQRVVAAESYWRQPSAWNKAAAKAGERHRVFCASLADAFEGEDTMPASEWRKVQDARRRLFAIIESTPHLDWLLLTKRPENIPAILPRYWNRDGLDNVWLGCSVENQATADERIPHLLRCPAAVRFLSCEPLLGPIELNPAWLSTDATDICPACGDIECNCGTIDWAIIGGESGAGGARPCDVAWIRSLVQQCKAAGVPAFVKQLGSKPRAHVLGDDGLNWPPGTMLGGADEQVGSDGLCTFALRDKKGGDPSEWPADLRVREFPIEQKAGKP